MLPVKGDNPGNFITANVTPPIQQDLLERLGDLPDEAVQRIVESAEPTLQERFERWLHLNPGIYPLMRNLALEMKRAGHDRGSISLLAEVARWEILTGRAEGDDFRLNNSYRSRLARLLMSRESELDGFFETRELKT